MDKLVYTPMGVCSKQMEIKIEDGIVCQVEITGGCNGNLQGIAQLVKGMKIEEVVSRLKGIKCGMKSSSCPDQLAQALLSYLDN